MSPSLSLAVSADVSPRHRCVVLSMHGVVVTRRLRRPSSSPYSLTVAVRRERKDNEERRFDIIVPRLVATSPTAATWHLVLVLASSKEGGD
jgi:hypothetical protein